MDKYIKLQLKRYPKMQELDIVKLLYQRFFGTVHALNSEESSYENLLSEIKSMKIDDTKYPLFEKIGNGYIRVNLIPYYRNNYNLFLLNKAFFSTSLIKIDEKIAYKKFEKLTKQLVNIEVNNKAVSHSEKYRQLYNPHYRVIHTNYLFLITEV